MSGWFISEDAGSSRVRTSAEPEQIDTESSNAIFPEISSDTTYGDISLTSRDKMRTSKRLSQQSFFASNSLAISGHKLSKSVWIP